MPAHPQAFNSLAPARISRIAAISEFPETAGAMAGSMHSPSISLAAPARIPKSVTIREDANVIEFFWQWDRAMRGDARESTVIERQVCIDASAALAAAENNLQKSEELYAAAFEFHSATVDVSTDQKEGMEYLRTWLKPYIENIWQMQSAVDLATEAADAAWEKLQRPASVAPSIPSMEQAFGSHPHSGTGQNLAFDASKAMGHDPDLLDRWHAASSEYKQAQHAYEKAGQQLAQASETFDHFHRGRDVWLERELLQARAMLSGAREQADRAGQDYASTKVMYWQVLAKIDKAGGPGEKVAAAWQAARLQLEASFNARDAARKGVMQAVDFLNSRPQYVERFLQERREDVSAAEDAVIAAQEWLSETLVTMDALTQRACADHTLLPARLATIAEEPEEWNSVAWFARGVEAAGQAEANGIDWMNLPSPDESDVALAGTSSLDTTAAPQSF